MACVLPKNENAKEIVEILTEKGFSDRITGGYFGRSKYCLGVKVKDYAEACLIGSFLGSGFGSVENFTPAKEFGATLVFRDAEIYR